MWDEVIHRKELGLSGSKVEAVYGRNGKCTDVVIVGGYSGRVSLVPREARVLMHALIELFVGDDAAESTCDREVEEGCCEVAYQPPEM